MQYDITFFNVTQKIFKQQDENNDMEQITCIFMLSSYEHDFNSKRPDMFANQILTRYLNT